MKEAAADSAFYRAPGDVWDTLYICLSLDFLVDDSQSTTAVAAAYVTCRGWPADVNLFLLVNLSRGALGSEDVVKRVVAVAERRKTESYFS